MQGTVQFVTAGGSGLVTTASSVHSLSQPVTVSVSQLGLNQNVSNNDDVPQLSQLDGTSFSDTDSEMDSEASFLPQLDGVSDSDDDNGDVNVDNQLNLDTSETKTEENKEDSESKQCDTKDEKDSEEKVDDVKPDTTAEPTGESGAIEADSINDDVKQKNNDDDDFMKNEPKEETEDEEEQMIQKDNMTDDAVRIVSFF